MFTLVEFQVVSQAESQIERWRGRRVRMAEIVNLRRARKDRKRAAKDARAVDNRTRFGRGKAEKREAEAERARAETALDGKRLDDHPGPGVSPGRKR